MKIAEDCADWLAEGRVGPISAAVVAVAAYCALQVVVMPLATALAGTGLGHDDAEQIMYMPYLWLGYGGSQPPLFSWLGWLTASLVGANVLALKLLKYGLLFVALVVTRATVLRLGYSRRAAAAAMFGLLLFPQIFWEMQHQLSHSVAALCFAALLIFACFNMIERRTILSFVLFGLAAAAAILSKYNNAILVFALVAAALSLAGTRRTVLDRRMIAGVAVMALALAPIVYWNLTHPGDMLARSYKFGFAHDGHWLQVAMTGILQLFIALSNFVALPVLVLGVALLRERVPLWRRGEAARLPERLLWLAMAFGFGLVVVLVATSGTTKIVDRWLLPVFFFLPMAVSIGLDGLSRRGARAQNLIICVGAIFALGALPVSWFSQVRGGQGMSRVVQLQYADLYREITADGPVRTVVADWHWPASLRLVDPGLVVLTSEVPDFAALIEEPAVLSWLDRDAPGDYIVQTLGRAGYELSGPFETVIVPEFLNGDRPGRKIGHVRLRKRDAPSPSG